MTATAHDAGYRVYDRTNGAYWHGTYADREEALEAARAASIRAGNGPHGTRFEVHDAVVPYHLTDAVLRADIDQTDPLAPGPRRRAEILLDLPAGIRALVVADAHRSRNVSGGRPSDALRSAAAAWHAGTLTEESHRRTGEALRSR